MKGYQAYFDRQSVSLELHQRLIELETTPAKKKAAPWQKWGTIAACAALLIGLGAYGLNQVWGFGHDAPLLTIGGDPTASPDQPDNISIGVSSSGEGDRYGFLALSGEEGKMPFPNLPDISYPHGTLDSAPCIALPQGSYANPLHEEDVEIMLWGSLENKDYTHFKGKTQTPAGIISCTVPQILFWEGFTLTGEARYDGEGNLWMVTLWGSNGDERFTIEIAPGKLPPTYLGINGGNTTVNGVEVKTQSQCYDSDGDGVEEYHYWSAFLTGDVGVRTEFIVPETAPVIQIEDEQGQVSHLYSFHSDLFLQFACGNPNFTLDHLLTNDDIVPWEETTFETLEEARSRTDFAPYLPQTAPDGFEGFYGHYSYQEGTVDLLWVCWDNGHDTAEVEVRLPEGASNDSFECADVNAPESYQGQLFVTLPAGDMSLEVVKALETDPNTAGFRFWFHLLHENGVVVSYSVSGGMTAEEVWALVEPTLPQ